MNDIASEANERTVLIFEDSNDEIPREGIDDKVIALGYTSLKRTLLTPPLRWKESELILNQLISEGNLLAVLLFLSMRSLFRTCGPEYQEPWNILLMEIKKTSALIIIDEECFSANYDDINLANDLIKAQVIFVKIVEEIIENIESRKGASHIKIKEAIDASHDLTNVINEIIALNNHDGKTPLLYDWLKSLIISLDRCTGNLRLLQTETKNNGKTSSAYLLNIYHSINEVRISVRNFPSDINEKLAGQPKGVELLLKKIQTSGVEIVTYKTKKEIIVRVHNFLDEVDKGIFLHLYVPKGRYQEDQLANFLRLFENYLQVIEKMSFFIDTRKTSHGLIYEFKSENSSINFTNMEAALFRFDHFMQLCQNDIKNAEAFLLKAGVNPLEVNKLLAKYIKEYRRLLLDTEQERKRKMLDIELRLESEVFDITNTTGFEVLEPVQPTALLSLNSNFEPKQITISNSSVIFNPGTVSFIEQAIYGDVHYTPQDKELIQIFEMYAQQRLESIQLRSELEKLKDPSLPASERKTAKQKILGFLFEKVAPAVSQSALNVLAAYLQKILTGS